MTPGNPALRVTRRFSLGATIEGAAFANTYCWVCRFHGDIIVSVRAYLDSAKVACTILRNEPK
jgi:uncharacterized protein